ncbi:DUF1841 family protein [Leeia sp. TBRC 13508]|uniref:DUF1841 family protein n=1 Tax=Leeia speluncae TaxID=2884804 RepID=A0ABS8DB21_9NEIS|nr:DUF1841 family protein [Leeia speluncae]MCB6185390.1 DUF1841 family protein [Leeia speluncae]
MFNPTRDQARQFLFDSWKKHLEGMPQTDLEMMAVDVMGLHPEYHDFLSNPDKFLDKDFSPEMGDTNPFLHLMMHLSIREQISIDQPKGVKRYHQELSLKYGSVHDAEHAVMDCLGEMIWHAQRYGSQPDPEIYLSCLAGKVA